MRAKWRTLVVGCVLVALLSAGCGSTHKSAVTHKTEPSASASAATGKAIGAGVRIAASRLPVGVVASITTEASPAVSGGLEVLSKTFQLGPSGPLPVRATITLPLTSPVPAGEAVVVATRESTGDPWRYLSATLAASRTAVTFTTTHFSIFSVLGYDVEQLVATFKTDFIDQVDGGATTSVVQPTCASSSRATADGYATRVASHTDTVLYCLGMSGSTAELKVVNNRHYPLEVLHPHMTVVDAGPIDYGALASLSHFGSGGYTILAPGAQATFGAALEPGHAGGVETQLDGLGQSLYQLQVGVNTLMEILGEFGAGSTSKAVNVANTMLGDTACLDSIDHGPAAMLASCFSPKDLVDSLGTKAIFLIPLMVAGPIVAFFESEFQALVNQFNNGDKEDIEVVRAAEPVTTHLQRALPVLAQPFAPGQSGYGHIEPVTISNGGDPTGVLTNIKWKSWGGAQAVGVGESDYVAGSEFVAEGREEPATVLAFHLGTCNGKLMYEAVNWYFPEYGQQLDTADYQNMCTGKVVGSVAIPPLLPLGEWAGPSVVISADSLGSVKVGMTLTQAENASGFTFNMSGDGYVYPTTLPDSSTLELYVRVDQNSIVRCVGAAGTPTSQVVTTPSGYHLGDSLAALQSMYGSRLHYVPAPPVGGLTDLAAYILSAGGNNLVFMVDSGGAVVGIAAGPNAGANSCTG